MTRYSLEKHNIHILLLEGIHPAAVEYLQDAGYEHITCHKDSLSEEALLEIIADVHFIGIRSNTKLNARVLSQAHKLVGIGCFCIGTNQVDLDFAEKAGIPVFNAPFSNTRSVAELVLGEIILLLRKIPEKNALAHRGIWKKSADASYEARGKTLGIVGYGHIGSQLGIMAESLGMQVRFYDVVSKLALGNAEPVASLSDLLSISDVVCLHVPETAETTGMMSAQELAQMRPGSILINASRGRVVDIDALALALQEGHIGGAGVDVFPREPKSKAEEFTSPLRGFDNVILTPHVGGSTEEAQVNIAKEVAEKLVTYSDNGSTLFAVNFPQVSLPRHYAGVSRLLHIHHNQPGIMQQINNRFSEDGINIAGQYLQTTAQIGYVVIDIESEHRDQALEKIRSIPGTIRARILY